MEYASQSLVPGRLRFQCSGTQLYRDDPLWPLYLGVRSHDFRLREELISLAHNVAVFLVIGCLFWRYIRIYYLPILFRIAIGLSNYCTPSIYTDLQMLLLLYFVLRVVLSVFIYFPPVSTRVGTRISYHMLIFGLLTIIISKICISIYVYKSYM